jgi:hypothetical protein
MSTTGTTHNTTTNDTAATTNDDPAVIAAEAGGDAAGAETAAVETAAAAVAQAEANSKPAATQRFYAIRKCSSLHAPAVFLSWEDCKPFVETPQGGEEAVEHETFDVLFDAMEYIYPHSSSDVDTSATGGTTTSSSPRNNNKPLANANAAKAKKKTVTSSAKTKKAKTTKTSTKKRSAQDASLEDDNADDDGDNENAATSTSSPKKKKKKASLKAPPKIRPPPSLLQDLHFDDLFQQLQAFQSSHGHTKIPVHPPSPLRTFVNNLRKAYKSFKVGNAQSLLTPERIVLLTSLETWEWQPKKHYNFDDRALQFLEWNTKYPGKDPKTYGEVNADEGLGMWVSKTRKKYVDFQMGVAGVYLTQAQIDKLTSWGFTWTSGHTKPTRLSAVTKSWEERFQEVYEWKQHHGNCLVPQSFPQLGGWVKDQRKKYKKYLLGGKKKYGLDDEKIARLANIGFCFDTRDNPADGITNATGVGGGGGIPGRRGGGGGGGDNHPNLALASAAAAAAARLPMQPHEQLSEDEQDNDHAYAPWDRYRGGASSLTRL